MNETRIGGFAATDLEKSKERKRGGECRNGGKTARMEKVFI